jgi:predicted outer membrane protein
MKLMSRSVVACVSACALLGIAAFAFAQNQPQAGQQLQQRGTTQAGGQQAAGADAQLANWLIVDNKGEVALAKFAESRIQNDAVKEFNTMLIKEHTDLVNQLQQMFPGVRVPEPTATGGERGRGAQTGASATEGAQGQRQNGTATGTTGAGAAHAAAGIDWLKIHQQKVNEELGLKERELESYKGTRLDEAYLGLQTGIHLDMVATLKAMRQHASSQLQPVLDQALAATQKHHNRTKTLMDQIGEGRSQEARKPRATTGSRD